LPITLFSKHVGLTCFIRDTDRQHRGHKAVFNFMKVNAPEPLKDTISYFDRIRKKRHRTIYDAVGLITEKETKELLQRAREFLSYTRR